MNISIIIFRVTKIEMLMINMVFIFTLLNGIYFHKSLHNDSRIKWIKYTLITNLSTKYQKHQQGTTKNILPNMHVSCYKYSIYVCRYLLKKFLYQYQVNQTLRCQFHMPVIIMPTEVAIHMAIAALLLFSGNLTSVVVFGRDKTLEWTAQSYADMTMKC